MPSAIDSNDKSEEKSNQQQKIGTLYENIPELKKYFNLHKEVGEGTFSTVYLATLKNDANKRKFAVKHIVPTCHPQRIKLELKCLKIIGGSNNVAGIDLCIRNMNNVVFVMPYLHHESFNDYYNKMNVKELSFYMKNLLIAIAHVHKFGIIHRDIKPSNFLYNRIKRQFLLVDFGLAQMHMPPCKQNKRKRESDPEEVVNQAKRQLLTSPAKVNNSDQENMPSNSKLPEKKNTHNLDATTSQTVLREKKVPRMNKYCNCYGRSTICTICLTKKPMVASRAGTPGFRPPEVLLKVTNQTTAIDVWAVGMIFLSLLSHSCTFFTSPDDITALAEMITLFGTDKLKKFAHSCNRHLVTSENMPVVELEELCNKLRTRENNIAILYPKSAYNLLEKLLELNPNKRISAEKALDESFLKQNA